MKLRLTDGSTFSLLSCKQEYDPEAGDKSFICELTPDYDFDELSTILCKDKIAEIISVINKENGEFIFQTKEYKNIKSIINDIKSKVITITFYDKDK